MKKLLQVCVLFASFNALYGMENNQPKAIELLTVQPAVQVTVQDPQQSTTDSLIPNKGCWSRFKKSCKRATPNIILCTGGAIVLAALVGVSWVAATTHNNMPWGPDTCASPSKIVKTCYFLSADDCGKCGSVESDFGCPTQQPCVQLFARARNATHAKCPKSQVDVALIDCDRLPGQVCLTAGIVEASFAERIKKDC